MTYPFHPAYGGDLKVVRRYRHQPVVCVMLSDGTHANLPCWMFDPIYCDSVSLREGALVSLAGLIQLRVIVDAQPPCFDGGESNTDEDDDRTGKSRTANDAI